MRTTVTCPPAEITLGSRAWTRKSPAALAAIYRRAADLIPEHGFDPARITGVASAAPYRQTWAAGGCPEWSHHARRRR